MSFLEAPSSNTILITANPTGPINSGETLHVTCSISGGNPLAILTWNCSGTAINKSSEKSAFLDIAFTVGQQDDGTICTCFASHLIATYNATAEKVVSLKVYCKFNKMELKRLRTRMCRIRRYNFQFLLRIQSGLFSIMNIQTI